MSTIKNLLFLFIIMPLASYVEDSYNKRVSDYNEKLYSLDNNEDKLEHIISGRYFLNGVQIPEFSITDASGSIISNESVSGKLVLLNFWFLGCPPCIEEMPSLSKINEMFKGEKFEIISICRDSWADLDEFLRDHPIPYRVAANGTELIDKVFNWPYGYPSNILIDEKGKIINVYRTLIESNKKSDYEKFVGDVRKRL